MITKNFESRLQKALTFFPCVTLTGARQTGKTTLLKNMLPDYNYVTLDLPSIAAMAEETPEVFFGKYQMPLIIDKVQYAPKMFRYLKDLIDQNRHKMGQIVLTGSQRFELMKNLSESLAGRTAVLELEGLDWSEYRNAPCWTDNNPADFDTFICRGGMPELTREPNMPLDMFFSSYLATYLERDVRQLVNVTNLRTFEQFIRLLAVRNAQQLDMTDLANNLGISSKTVGSWISVLEASGQITLLRPWFGNFGKRIVKTPKVYFNDTGLICWLLGIDKSNLKTSPFAGSIFETAVFAQLRKANKLGGSQKQIYYYRDVSQTEADFLILGGGCTILEAKLTEHPNTGDAQNLKKISDILTKLPTMPPELQPLSFSLVCNTPADYSMNL
ncbi:MAG: ATP-binding protein, partial [Spirochaetales bacterium]|nr:ATP-binding protein [Spirochaetales bacterium]